METKKIRTIEDYNIFNKNQKICDKQIRYERRIQDAIIK